MPPPAAVVCELCGGKFSKHSLPIHQKACVVKRELSTSFCPVCDCLVSNDEYSAHVGECKKLNGAAAAEIKKANRGEEGEGEQGEGQDARRRRGGRGAGGGGRGREEAAALQDPRVRPAPLGGFQERGGGAVARPEAAEGAGRGAVPSLREAQGRGCLRRLPRCLLQALQRHDPRGEQGAVEPHARGKGGEWPRPTFTHLEN
jgi:hypothetical protein